MDSPPPVGLMTSRLPPIPHGRIVAVPFFERRNPRPDGIGRAVSAMTWYRQVGRVQTSGDSRMDRAPIAPRFNWGHVFLPTPAQRLTIKYSEALQAVGCADQALMTPCPASAVPRRPGSWSGDEAATTVADSGDRIAVKPLNPASIASSRAAAGDHRGAAPLIPHAHGTSPAEAWPSALCRGERHSHRKGQRRQQQQHWQPQCQRPSPIRPAVMEAPGRPGQQDRRHGQTEQRCCPVISSGDAT